MKAVSFDYERPRNLSEALALAGRGGGVVKVIAGGQSLGPMLNLRLVRPDLLVDIAGLPELRRFEETADGLFAGACITHADVEDRRLPDVTNGALPAVARNIAYRAVRNRGTIGGSLVHADPAADWISGLAAMGAKAVVQGPSGRRTLPAEDLMTGVFETSLNEGELLEGLEIPRLSKAARWGYYKACRKTGEFAHAIGAVLSDPERGVLRAVIGAIERKPIVLADARPLFGGDRADLADHLDTGIADDLLRRAGVSDAIDRRIHVVALRRAALQARRR